MAALCLGLPHSKAEGEPHWVFCFASSHLNQTHHTMLFDLNGRNRRPVLPCGNLSQEGVGFHTVCWMCIIGRWWNLDCAISWPSFWRWHHRTWHHRSDATSLLGSTPKSPGISQVGHSNPTVIMWVFPNFNFLSERSLGNGMNEQEGETRGTSVCRLYKFYRVSKGMQEMGDRKEEKRWWSP